MTFKRVIYSIFVFNTLLTATIGEDCSDVRAEYNQYAILVTRKCKFVHGKNINKNNVLF